MASDERCAYKARRCIPHGGCGAYGTTDPGLDVIQRRKPGAYKDSGQPRPGIARCLRNAGLPLLNACKAVR
jgi:hypothetical protein